MGKLVVGEETESTSAEQWRDESANAQLAMVIYALYAVAIFIGITSIAAIIINYVKRDDVRGTWLESHFDWQISTFWLSLLAGVVSLLLVVASVFMQSWAPALLAIAIGGFSFLWYCYRVIKGILRLNDKREVE